MRKPFVAGNWKMHGSLSQVNTLAKDIRDKVSTFQSIDIAVLPPFVYLNSVQQILKQSNLALGAQNLYLGEQGAFTGEVSGNMLKDIGCEYVLVGHSERRTIFQENLKLSAEKFKAALTAKLIPILCVGETKAEREQGKTEAIIREQILSVIDLVGINAMQNSVIAYEPVWAIGTGLTATPEMAEKVHIFIRELIAQNNVDLAKTMRILYGGSMKPDNAASLLAMPNIDGGLIGGASLDADSFATICKAAMLKQKAAA